MNPLTEKIIEAKEILGDSQKEKVSKYLKLENFNGKAASCPFHGTDKTPSFIWNEEEKYFKCFSCGKVFSVLDMYIETEGTYKKAAKKLLDEAGVQYNSTIFKNEVKDKEEFFKNYRFPREEKTKISGVAEEYCNKRGISKKTLEYLDIRQDRSLNIVFELRDCDDRLLGVKYRPSHTVKKNENKMFWQPNASACSSLYNIKRVDFSKPVVITEGYFDCLAIVEAGYTNVMSIPHGAEDTSWIDFNYELLEQMDEIILWFDNDEAGQRGLKKVVSRLGEYKCKIVKSTSAHEDAVAKYYKKFASQQEIRKTDANNILLACGKESVISLINSAEEIPIENILDLMEQEEFNIENTNYIPSGIKAIDKELYGFIDGTLNIWTAYSGVGKTTLISQTCVLEAVNRGETVFWFNAESTTNQMLNWILSQAAGRDNIVECKSSGDFTYYNPTIEASQQIKAAYRGKIYVYDNLLLSSAYDILEKMKYMYKRMGTKVFVLDNWLCMNFKGKTDTEVTGLQVDFMNELIHFCKKNMLEIHLVCHPRKPVPNSPLSEYDILGTSNIVNMADRIYGLEKVNDESLKDKGFDRQFTIFKDRTLGVKGQVVGLYYDRATRRLYSTEEEKYRSYSWEKEKIDYSKYSKSFGDSRKIIGRSLLDYEKENPDRPF